MHMPDRTIRRRATWMYNASTQPHTAPKLQEYDTRRYSRPTMLTLPRRATSHSLATPLTPAPASYF